MVTISGGDKLTAKLAELSKSVTKAATLNVGFIDGATYPDGTSVALVAALNEFGTSKTPSRPFFRNMIASKSDEWPDAVAGLLEQTGYDAEKTLGLMGEGISGQLREEIATFSGAPLSPKTIAAKGSGKQLVDSGQMLESVTYKVD